jgi:hypothetical protein
MARTPQTFNRKGQMKLLSSDSHKKMLTLDHSKVRTQLELTTKIAVWVVAGILLIWGVKLHLNESSPQRLLTGLRTGNVLSVPAKLSCGGAPRTLVIAMKTSCASCTENIPFYNQIAENYRANRDQLCVAAVFTEPENDVRRYVQAQRLNVEAIGGTDLTQLRVRVMPTIILIDDLGRVLDFWVGQLGEREKQSVVGAIRKE